MKSLLAATALSTLAATMPLFHPPAKPAATPAAYAVDVRIQPAGELLNPYQLLARDNDPSKHVCSVSVTDLLKPTTKFAGPRIVLSPGARRSATRTVDGYEVGVTASLSTNGQQAAWDVTLRKDGRLLTRQTSDTWLRPAKSE